MRAINRSNKVVAWVHRQCWGLRKSRYKLLDEITHTKKPKSCNSSMQAGTHKCLQPSAPSLKTRLKEEAPCTTPQSESLHRRQPRRTQGFWLKGPLLPHSALHLNAIGWRWRTKQGHKPKEQRKGKETWANKTRGQWLLRQTTTGKRQLGLYGVRGVDKRQSGRPAGKGASEGCSVHRQHVLENVVARPWASTWGSDRKGSDGSHSQAQRGASTDWNAGARRCEARKRFPEKTEGEEAQNCKALESSENHQWVFKEFGGKKSQCVKKANETRDND